jgi:hypothetical protein
MHPHNPQRQGLGERWPADSCLPNVQLLEADDGAGSWQSVCIKAEVAEAQTCKQEKQAGIKEPTHVVNLANFMLL